MRRSILSRRKGRASLSPKSHGLRVKLISAIRRVVVRVLPTSWVTGLKCILVSVSGPRPETNTQEVMAHVDEIVAMLEHRLVKVESQLLELTNQGSTPRSDEVPQAVLYHQPEKPRETAA
jgi:hypothetical protein